MKNFTYESHWDEIKGQLKQRYGQLTDDDVTFVKGKAEELFGRLREKLGMSQEDLDALLAELNTTATNRVSAAKAKLGDLAGELRGRAHSVADDVKAKAAAAAEQAKAQASVAYDQARDRARGLFSEGEDYVRHNPRESLIAALCAGFVAGLLIRH